MKLSELLARPAVAGLVSLRGESESSLREHLKDPDIQAVSDDSRNVGPGVLFAGIGPAEEFLPAAVALGPAAVLVSSESSHSGIAGPILHSTDPFRAFGLLAAELCGRPTDRLELTAVTGTNGKTSFAWIMHQSLVQMGLPSAMIGTLGVHGRDGQGREFSEQTGYTTPRPPELQKILAALGDRGIRRVVLEASSEGLDLGRLWGCRFACAVYTNLTQDHLDHHGTMEHYFQSKRRLFQRTAETGGRLILCAEDESGQRLAEEFPQAEILTSTEVEAIRFPARFQRINAALVRRTLYGREGFRLLPGEDLVGGGPDPDDLLSRLPPVPGRFNILIATSRDRTESSGPLGIVDYAHTPDAVQNVLTAVRDMPVDRIVCVLGCGGDRDPGKRAPMGRAAAELSDCVIVTDDNPRSEDPASIRAAVLAGARLEVRVAEDGQRLPEVIEIASRRAAIRAAVHWARTQSGGSLRVAVVVAGKGHEAEQIFAHGKEPFSDAHELQAALQD